MPNGGGPTKCDVCDPGLRATYVCRKHETMLRVGETLLGMNTEACVKARGEVYAAIQDQDHQKQAEERDRRVERLRAEAARAEAALSRELKGEQ